MTDFLLELRSEEIPARMQDKARNDLARLFATELDKAGLRADAIVTFATPRRLALIARDLPAETAAVSAEIKGPRAGAPPQALEGFLRKTGLTEGDLTTRDGVLFAVIDKPGRATADVLAEAIPAIVRAFPWPKSMRWGAASTSTESLRWVRPLHGIVALLGENIVPVEIAGVQSGATTLGHRFHHPGPITIGSAADYEEKLRACHVVVDQDQRRAIIRERATALAAEAGLDLIEDEGLVAENAGLTEWPVPLLGRFDAAFLAVPPEVIQLTARVNQKYFVCRDADGKLANAFVCTANIDAADGGAKIVEGNRKVLAARLADARFFYDTDLKVPLEEQATKLEKIVFHEKLGTVADKVDRVAKLARWLVEEGIVTSSPLPLAGGAGGGPVTTGGAISDTPSPNPSRKREGDLADQAERAARLAKADLVTGMVGEFPELQGVMGGYYAAAQGEDAAVAEAVRDHYKPVGQGDDVPTAPVTVAVSLADKLDTLIAFFSTGMFPSGSRDPFALRRSAIAMLRLDQENRLNISWGYAILTAYIGVASSLMKQAYKPDLHAQLLNEVRDFEGRDRADLSFEEEMKLAAKATPNATQIIDFKYIVPVVVAFLVDRLEVQQREHGMRYDFINAAFSLAGEVRFQSLVARVRALQSFVGTEDGANLLAGYKRAANILKKEGHSAPAKAGALADGASDNPALRPSPEHGTQKQLSYTPETAEADLIAALDAAEPAAAQAVQAEDFEAAMAALATLRAPIDAFFDSVTVNDPDPDKRAARLALLARARAAVHTVADFSKIEG